MELVEQILSVVYPAAAHEKDQSSGHLPVTAHRTEAPAAGGSGAPVADGTPTGRPRARGVGKEFYRYTALQSQAPTEVVSSLLKVWQDAA